MFEAKGQSNYLDEVFSFGNKRSVWLAEKFTLHKVDRLRREDFTGLPIFIMRDHDGAGRIWDQALELSILPKNSTLVHIDAHHDLGLPDELPNSVEELSFANFQAGSFILPRVNTGIIKDIVWIRSKSTDPRLADMNRNIGSSRLLAKPNVKVVKGIPKMQADLLDIDLDFFTDGNGEWYQNSLLKRNLHAFMLQLAKGIKGIKIITIATSPGYIQSGKERLLLESILDFLFSRSKSHFLLG